MGGHRKIRLIEVVRIKDLNTIFVGEGEGLKNTGRKICDFLIEKEGEKSIMGKQMTFQKDK